MFFSKSKYCSFVQCPKIAWLDKNKPEEKSPLNEVSIKAIEDGHKIGKMAQGLFGDSIDVETFDDNFKLDISKMLEKTKIELAKGTENICEAAFEYDGFYCAIDILHKENGGYAIYEVKSSKNLHEQYYVDIACQKYILDHCGINVTRTYLVNINNDYVRHGDIDIHGLLQITDVSAEIDKFYKEIDGNLPKIEKMLSLTDEPDNPFNENCKDCAYFNYCTRNLPKYNPFTFTGIKKALELYKKNIITFEDIKKNKEYEGLKKVYLDYAINNIQDTYIEKDNIKAFINKLKYPLYFLDFETICETIPPFDSVKTNEIIPFMYSLNVVENENAEVTQKSHFAKIGTDPRREIAENLCKSISANGTIIAYNCSVEKNIILKLAKKFPDLSSHLQKLAENFVDLEEPFKKGYCYNLKMGKRYSIKSVYPALCPEAEKQYNTLEGVHDGGGAMTTFLNLPEMEKTIQEEQIKGLIDYCELDTISMILILRKLIDFVKD